MKKNDKPSAMELELDGTLVGSILACMASGKFSDYAKGKKLEDGQMVLGEMTSFEKACLTVADEAKSKHNGLVNGGIPSQDKNMILEVGFLSKRADQAMGLMWSSIEERLNSGDFRGVGLAEGFQIFGLSKSASGCDECPISDGCPNAGECDGEPNIIRVRAGSMEGAMLGILLAGLPGMSPGFPRG
ncbi:MAG: hypothetical protein Q7T51_03270 [Candidatus Moranbacteria bacterium]|nr:hypothetical protein [Candidatus Moranbacteria bacterium]